MTCAIAACGLKATDAHGYCAIHHVHFVVMRHHRNYLDSAPIKVALRKRLANYGHVLEEAAAILEVSYATLRRLLDHRTVWIRRETFDFWMTKLHLDPVDFYESAA